MAFDKQFNSAPFFSGGAGFFVEFHDVIKPVYLYAIFKMIIENESYGLPTDIIKEYSILSIIEWYKNRRYRNPLKQLDWANKIPIEELDKLMEYLLQDESLYKLSPTLNIERMIGVYNLQHMNFPWVIYSEEYEKGIDITCREMFKNIPYKYTYGNMKDAIKKCEQNFTYIFSDIEKVKIASEILHGTCSHILIARDYRYNYIDNCKTLKYDLGKLAGMHPFLRIDTTTAMDIDIVYNKFDNIISR